MVCNHSDAIVHLFFHAFCDFSAFMNLGSVLLQLKGLQNRHTKHLIESYCEFMMVILIPFGIIKYVYLCELHIWVSFVPNIFRLYQIQAHVVEILHSVCIHQGVCDLLPYIHIDWFCVNIFSNLPIVIDLIWPCYE